MPTMKSQCDNGAMSESLALNNPPADYDTIPNSNSSNQAGITAAECCKVLSAALENAMIYIRKEGGDLNQNAANQDFVSSEFVSIMTSSVSERQSYLNAIRSVKFQKQHARRLFSALYPALKYIFEQEHYVPLSAFEEDESCNDNEGNTSMNHQKRRENARNSTGTELSQVTDDNYDVVPDEASTEALLFIKYSAMMVLALLDNQLQRRNNHVNPKVDRVYDMIEEVYVVAEMLHNHLFALNSCGREGMSVQKEIISMCEAYWKGHFSDREELVTQLIPLLVIKSLNGNATNADIKRLWSMREAFRLLDFQEKSTSSELRNLLLKTVTSALFLKNPDGRKVIAFFFQLDVSLVQDLHHSIKIQIPYSKASTLEAYGEIYLTAWKNVAQNNGGNLDRIQDDEDREGKTIQSSIEDALQDLMVSNLHAPSPHIGKSVLTVLSPLLGQKSIPLFDDLLYRMYNPILWRALSATNPLIRIYASNILHVTFPLEDPNAGKCHREEVVSKTVETFINLLNDDDPKVRIAGCDASIRIMGVCWDLLRSEHIRSLLNEIVIKHVNDSSSAAVRAQAVKGITLLLDAPASHGVLRPLLPLVGNHIHDSIEKVRLECVKMLLKLKALKTFKYYHVVPSYHILSRLAVEGTVVEKPNGPVASAITELLVNSFFPKGAKGSDQMRRTLEFIKQNPLAARVFYANISNHLEINNISKLIVMLFKTIKIGVEKDKKDIIKNKSRNVSMDSDDEEVEQMRVSASNTQLMAGISETLCTVWSSVCNQLLESENKQCLEFIQKSITLEEIAKLCAYFEDMKVRKAPVKGMCINQVNCDSICTSLLSCITLIPSPKIKKFCSLMQSTVKKRKYVNIFPYYVVLCSWNLHDDVAFSIGKAIESMFTSVTKDEWNDSTTPEEHEKDTRGKRKRPSSLKDENENTSDVPDIPCGKVALEILTKMLNGKNENAILMRDKILSSEIATSYIESTLMKATGSAEKIVSQEENKRSDITDVLKACETYCKFILHKEAISGPMKLSLRSQDYLFWISNSIVKVLSQLKDEEDLVTSSPFQDLNISTISAIDSRGSDLQPALTPLQFSLSRRRSNSCSSSHLDESFASMEKRGASDFMVKTDITTSVRAQSLGIALIKSTIDVYGEYLIAGADDGNFIIKHVKEWHKAIRTMNNFMYANIELFPSLCRLLVISGKTTLNYDLLEELLSSFMSLQSNGSCHNSDLLIKMTEIIMSIRNSNSMVLLKNFMANLIKSIVVLLSKDANQDPMNVGDDKSIDDAVTERRDGWLIVFQTILNHGNALPILVEALLETLSSEKLERCQINQLMQLLHITCKACPQGKVGGNVRALLQRYVKDYSETTPPEVDIEKLKVLIDAITV